MTDLQALLLAYDELTPDERSQADAHLAEHPEDRSLVEEGRALRRLFGSLRESVISDEQLAQVVARRALGRREPQTAPPLGRFVDAARDADPDVAARYAVMENRLADLQASLPSHEEHLQQLMQEVEGTSRPPRTARPRRAGDRRAFTPRRVAASSLAAVAVVIALVVGAHFVVEAARPAHVRLAALDSAPAAYRAPLLRGPAPERVPRDAALQRGLDLLDEARVTTFGLFGRYDADRLRTARRHLERSLADGRLDPAAATATYVMIGRIHLHEGDVEAARRSLHAASGGEGPAVLDARELLEQIDAVDP